MKWNVKRVGDDVWARQEGLTGSSNLYFWQYLGARGAAGVWVSLCNLPGRLRICLFFCEAGFLPWVTRVSLPAWQQDGG
jgi:hypothetical protein